MSVYYNEIEPYPAQWLRNLAAAGLIPAGDVDTRSIADVRPDDLRGYVQCHFFAGLGGWPLALAMAGWDSDRPVWTGSCPCQPFSQGGSGEGFSDERHLWPLWHWLIQQHQPDIVFGEQVESPLGRVWLDLVSTDMEGLGYACGPVDTPSAGVGAPNIRQRFFWVADAGCSIDERRRGPWAAYGPAGAIEGEAREREWRGDAAWRGMPVGRLGITGSAGLPHAEPPDLCRARRRGQGRTVEQSGSASNPWRELEWLDCIDGRKRPTEPGLFPLAPRLPGHVGQLRAYGNAINPWAAAEVIAAWMECEP